jgi:ABC-type molybdate transport system ATPase subunit
VTEPQHDAERGITRVRAEGLELVLPHDVVKDANFPLVVRISGEEIVVFGEKPQSISSRNVIEGSVTELRERDGVVDFTAVTPLPVRVRITRAAADDLRIATGARVWLAMRSRAFRVVG